MGIDLVTNLRQAIHLAVELFEHGFCAQTFGIDFEFDHVGDGFSQITIKTASKKYGNSNASALVKTGYDALSLSFDGFFLQGLTLVTDVFAFADTEFHLDVSALPVSTQDG